MLELMQCNVRSYFFLFQEKMGQTTNVRKVGLKQRFMLTDKALEDVPTWPNVTLVTV